MQGIKIKVYYQTGENRIYDVPNSQETLNLYSHPSSTNQRPRYSYVFSIHPRPIINLSTLDLSTITHEESVTENILSTLPILKLGSLNIRGISQFNKRETIDQYFTHLNLQIVTLQEVKISCSTIWTTNYIWKINHYNRQPTGRGTAILINQSLNKHLIRFVSVTENLCFLELRFNHLSIKSFIIINFYSYCEGDPLSSLEYSNLQQLIKKFINKSEVLILGDFNAHIGAEDISEDDQLIGTKLYHLHTNTNGENLLRLIRYLKLEVLTTKRHKTLVTWSNGTLSSQLDHLLVPITSKYQVHLVTGHFVTALSDHKLIIT
jgi:exonuclease III